MIDRVRIITEEEYLEIVEKIAKKVKTSVSSGSDFETKLCSITYGENNNPQIYQSLEFKDENGNTSVAMRGTTPLQIKNRV